MVTGWMIMRGSGEVCLSWKPISGRSGMMLTLNVNLPELPLSVLENTELLTSVEALMSSTSTLVIFYVGPMDDLPGGERIWV